MSTQEPIGVLIVGTGIIATEAHLPALQALPSHFKIVACCNRSRAKAETFGGNAGLDTDAIYTDYEAALQHTGVDLVALLVPIEYNREYAEKAIQANKHVLLEKPLAHTIQDGAALVVLSRKIGADAQSTSTLKMMVAENFLFHDGVLRAANQIRNGDIGQLVSFTFSAIRSYQPDNRYVATKWRQNPRHVGGYLSDAGVHDWAYIIQLVGLPVQVFANARQLYDLLGTLDTCAVTCLMRNGSIGTYHLTMASGGPSSMRFEGIGTHGTIVMQDGKITVYRKSPNSTDDSASTLVKEEYTNTVERNGYPAEWLDTYQVIRENKLPCVPVDLAFQHLAVISAIVESATTGKSVVVPSPDDILSEM